MTSLHTNTAAMTALRTLSTVNGSLADTQSQMATGLRIRAAEDGSAYWSIATTMRSDNRALSAVSDSLGLGAAIVSVASQGMNAAIDVMDEVKAKLVAAREPGVDKVKIDTELSQLKEQIRSIASSASFSGQNWLHMTDVVQQNSPKEIVSSFTRDVNGKVSVQTIQIDMTASFDTVDTFYLVSEDGCTGIVTNSAYSDALGNASDWVLFGGKDHLGHSEISLSSATTASEIDEMVSTVDAMISRMVEVESIFGSIAKRISIQSTFIDRLSDAYTGGISRLVDADMTDISVKTRALQTQQSLANEALSIANSGPASLLQLFR
jgi:flagellin